MKISERGGGLEIIVCRERKKGKGAFRRVY